MRSLYDPEAPSAGWRARLAFRSTDGFVVSTRACARQLGERFDLDPRRILYQDPPTEVRTEGGDLRARLGLGDDDLAIGITARIQPHRRFDLLWEIARRVAAREPRARFVLLGRGNTEDTERLVHEPLRRLGIADRVILPGYLYEPDYTRALRALDLFLFLVPGSDGTCRAVREAMSLALPVVATRRGFLPELLDPHPDLIELGPAGLTIDEDADAGAEAIASLCADPELRRSLGRAGQARARGPMDPRAAARRLMAFYGELRARAGASP